MEDEHLDTIPETESDELIKSSVEDLVQIPSESEDSSEGILAPLSPVIDTLLTFSSENEDKVFNHGVLDSKEKSPSSPSPSQSGLERRSQAVSSKNPC
ncbi:hypothetical protein Tco_0434292 [Tanacetum coccineum]